MHCSALEIVEKKVIEAGCRDDARRGLFINGLAEVCNKFRYCADYSIDFIRLFSSLSI